MLGEFPENSKQDRRDVDASSSSGAGKEEKGLVPDRKKRSVEKRSDARQLGVDEGICTTGVEKGTNERNTQPQHEGE
jgi:hypothetical protein